MVAAVTVTKPSSCRGAEEHWDRPDSAMRGFQRGSQLLAAALRTSRVPRAQLRSHPPAHPLSTGVSILGGLRKWEHPGWIGPNPLLSGLNCFGKGVEVKRGGGGKGGMCSHIPTV